ncbi:hypothetical protein Pelo_6470 [Pelomyxa schiedti]|nr:hypothetical protein Pelo_6470 [Pelomyxa schiedti]
MTGVVCDGCGTWYTLAQCQKIYGASLSSLESRPRSRCTSPDALSYARYFNDNSLPCKCGAERSWRVFPKETEGN